MTLLAGGGSAQLRRDPGTAGAVDGQLAFGSALAGARLATALPFAAQYQGGDGQAQQSQSVVATLSLGGTVERERAGGASLTVGTVGQTLDLGGIAERERAGGLATAAGTATIAPGGTVERERAGGIELATYSDKQSRARIGSATMRDETRIGNVVMLDPQRIGSATLRDPQRIGSASMRDTQRIGSAVLPKKPRAIRH